MAGGVVERFGRPKLSIKNNDLLRKNKNELTH